LLTHTAFDKSIAKLLGDSIGTHRVSILVRNHGQVAAQIADLRLAIQVDARALHVSR